MPKAGDSAPDRTAVLPPSSLCCPHRTTGHLLGAILILASAQEVSGSLPGRAEPRSSPPRIPRAQPRPAMLTVSQTELKAESQVCRQQERALGRLWCHGNCFKLLVNSFQTLDGSKRVKSTAHIWVWTRAFTGSNGPGASKVISKERMPGEGAQGPGPGYLHLGRSFSLESQQECPPEGLSLRPSAPR